MIHPAPGYAFIIEDTREVLTKESALKDSGFVATEEGKLAGTTGVILSINDNKQCPQCSFGMESGFQPGERVIYSKFVAEQIDVISDDIPRGRLRAVPVESILGKLC